MYIGKVLVDNCPYTTEDLKLCEAQRHHTEKQRILLYLYETYRCRLYRNSKFKDRQKNEKLKLIS